jgi:hypothetical protein
MPGSPKKRARARQPITPATFGRICREVASGKSLRKALNGKGMPGRHVFYDYIEGLPERAGQYARARQRGIELHVDEIIDLAFSANAQNAAAVRLKVDTLKWLASKLVPKVYGDRQQLDVRHSLDADLGERLRRARERVALEHQPLGPVLEAERVINVVPTPAEVVPAIAEPTPRGSGWTAPIEPPAGFEIEEEKS